MPPASNTLSQRLIRSMREGLALLVQEQLLLQAEPVVASTAGRHVLVSTPYQLLCSIPCAREAQRKARGLPAAPALAV